MNVRLVAVDLLDVGRQRRIRRREEGMALERGEFLAGCGDLLDDSLLGGGFHACEEFE